MSQNCWWLYSNIKICSWLACYKESDYLFTDLYADENMLYFIEDSGNVVFSCNEIGILHIDLYNNNLDDTNYMKDDADTIILIRLIALHS